MSPREVAMAARVERLERQFKELSAEVTRLRKAAQDRDSIVASLASASVRSGWVEQ